MTKKFTNGYALLISVDENSVPNWALPDVLKDVNALRDVLIHPQRCGYDPKKVRVIAGAKATRQGIFDGLAWLANNLAADTSGNATALVYYTGHGWRDPNRNPPEFYFIPYDVKPTSVAARALAARDFAAEVAALQPKRLFVVLDCCHAAGADVKDLTAIGNAISSAMPVQVVLANEAEATADITPTGGKDLSELALGAGRAILSSSQAAEKSWLRKDGSMSVFTYYLIEALTGHAQPAGGANEVLVSDVMSHVYRNVPKLVQAERNQPQHPDYQVSGNFPVALLLGGKGLAAGQAAPDPLQSPKPSARAIKITVGDGVAIVGDNNLAAGAGGVVVGGSVGGSITTAVQPKPHKPRLR
ncbi:MAG: caspase family protein [Anaerolineae bacterium]|nr:caspase family protein [Anaerolineae bacterium]